jgi:hypothetical protein
MNERDIRQLLSEVAEQEEEHRDEPKLRVKSARLPKDPAQVYAIRIPTSRLEDVRRLAVDRHEAPSAMLRAWVLERLDLELAPPAPVILIKPHDAADRSLAQGWRWASRGA